MSDEKRVVLECQEEIAHRKSPELWPENVPGVWEFSKESSFVNGDCKPGRFKTELEPQDVRLVNELGQLNADQLMEHTRGLQNIAFLLGTEEGLVFYTHLQKTCLYDLHVKHDAKMVPFAGFEMPLQYGKHTIADSSIHTRKHVSIFDVSHMMQLHITGRHSIEFIESLTTADLHGLGENRGCLSVFTNENGGILDDLIVSKIERDWIYMVTNANCIEKDFAYLTDHSRKWRTKGKDISVRRTESRGLIAVQGPESVTLMQEVSDIDMSSLYFMHSTIGEVCGIPDCRVTRCGYTGEDGVEISVDTFHAVELVERLMRTDVADVKLAGLGARDVLRIEAALCLYGNDINESTTPVEANIAFVIAKRRRDLANFPGARKILTQLKQKNWPKRRVGLISEPGRAPRNGLPLIDPVNKASVGFVTSGCPSPNLQKNIAMGYVDRADAVNGKELLVDFGSKTSKVTVTKMPFVPTAYYSPTK